MVRRFGSRPRSFHLHSRQEMKLSGREGMEQDLFPCGPRLPLHVSVLQRPRPTDVLTVRLHPGPGSP